MKIQKISNNLCASALKREAKTNNPEAAFKSRVKTTLKTATISTLMALSSMGIGISSCSKEEPAEENFFNECPYVTTNLENYTNTSDKVSYVLQSLGVIPETMGTKDIQTLCITGKDNNKYKLTKLPESTDNTVQFKLDSDGAL